jgi:hypothetical protein
MYVHVRYVKWMMITPMVVGFRNGNTRPLTQDINRGYCGIAIGLVIRAEQRLVQSSKCNGQNAASDAENEVISIKNADAVTN